MRSPLCVRASEKNVQIGKRKDGRLAKCCTFDAIVTSEQHDAFLLHLRRKLASPFCSLLSLVRVGKDGYIMDGHHRASRVEGIIYRRAAAVVPAVGRGFGCSFVAFFCVL